MYQSIDDEIEEFDEDPRGGFVLPLLLGGAGLAVIATLVFLTSPGAPSRPGDIVVAEPAVTAAYRRAISETNPALRRARLTDFVNQNSQSTRAATAQAQLAVLDAAEAADWQSVITAVYRPGAEVEEKKAAVEAFRSKWGGFLGGRDNEIAALLTKIAGEEDVAPRPDRSLPSGPSPFPSNVPGDRLAGGPVTIAPPVPIYRPPVLAPIATPPPETGQAAVITPVRIRRNVTPRYPRKAQRRKIDAVVTMRLDINVKGRVETAELVSVEADRYGEDFVKASERAAMRTRFHPKTVDGDPVASFGVLKRYRFQSRN